MSSDMLSRLSGFWGIYQLAKTIGWKEVKLLSPEPTERHRCYVRTPAGDKVWVECDEPKSFDFSRPARFAYWRPYRLLTGPLPSKTKPEVLVSTSFSTLDTPFPLFTEKALSMTVRREEAKGFGSEIAVAFETLEPCTFSGGLIEVRREIGKGRWISISDDHLVLASDTAQAKLGPFASCTLISSRRLLALSCDHDATAIVDGKTGLVWLFGLREATLWLEPRPSRVRWMQPFALVEDFIDVGEKISSNYLEVPVAEDKICLISRFSMNIFSEEKGRFTLSIAEGGPLALALTADNDLSPMSVWTSLFSKPLKNVEIPSLRLIPPVFVAHKIRASWNEGVWFLSITFSNPYPKGMGGLLVVERPFYLAEVSFEGEKIKATKINSVELFLPGYSTLEVNISIRKARLIVAESAL